MPNGSYPPALGLLCGCMEAMMAMLIYSSSRDDPCIAAPP